MIRDMTFLFLGEAISLLGRHKSDLFKDARRRRLLGHKPKLEVVDDPDSVFHAFP